MGLEERWSASLIKTAKPNLQQGYQILYAVGVYDYLLEREQEELFRTSVRDIDFPDGKTRRIETYRLVWRWYDRAAEYEFGPDKDWLLNIVLKSVLRSYLLDCSVATQCLKCNLGLKLL